MAARSIVSWKAYIAWQCIVCLKAERADEAFSRNNGRRDLWDNSQPRFPNKLLRSCFSLIMLVDIKQAQHRCVWWSVEGHTGKERLFVGCVCRVNIKWNRVALNLNGIFLSDIDLTLTSALQITGRDSLDCCFGIVCLSLKTNSALLWHRLVNKPPKIRVGILIFFLLFLKEVFYFHQGCNY